LDLDIRCPTLRAATLPRSLPNFKFNVTSVSHVKMPLCDYSALEQHQMTKLRLQCQNCGRLLRIESGLEQHRQAVHSCLSLTHGKDSTRKESLRLYCRECDRFFLTPEPLPTTAPHITPTPALLATRRTSPATNPSERTKGLQDTFSAETVTCAPRSP
jgi:hypothetical protein